MNRQKWVPLRLSFQRLKKSFRKSLKTRVITEGGLSLSMQAGQTNPLYSGNTSTTSNTIRATPRETSPSRRTTQKPAPPYGQAKLRSGSSSWHNPHVGLIVEPASLSTQDQEGTSRVYTTHPAHWEASREKQPHRRSPFRSGPRNHGPCIGLHIHCPRCC